MYIRKKYLKDPSKLGHLELRRKPIEILDDYGVILSIESVNVYMCLRGYSITFRYGEIVEVRKYTTLQDSCINHHIFFLEPKIQQQILKVVF